MKEITLKGLKDEVVALIKEKYGYDIYKNNFVTEVIETSQQRIGNIRYERFQKLCIKYHDNKEEYPIYNLQVVEDLYFLLEIIELDGNKVRATNLSHKTINGITHFFVEYNYHFLLPEEIAKMESLHKIGGVKNRN